MRSPAKTARAVWLGRRRYEPVHEHLGRGLRQTEVSGHHVVTPDDDLAHLAHGQQFHAALPIGTGDGHLHAFDR